jgi:cytochrome P450
MNAPQLDINFHDGSYVNDPFPVYEQIRATGRVVWNEALHGWMVPGFEDCRSVLTDRGDRFTQVSGDPELVYWMKTPNMIMVDGIEHSRLRSILSPLFTPSAVARWQTRVREVVDSLLRPLVERSEAFDLIADFTMIPTVIVADMLGVPEDRYEDFRRWSHNITSNLAYGHEDEATQSLMRQTSAELNDYMQFEVERHKKDRPDDLITFMLDSPMTDGEIVSTSNLLLLAGYDTTAKVMSNCVVVLERHPEERRRLAADASLIPSAIEEVLRWWGLLQASPKRAIRNTEIAGTKIKEGQMVYNMLAAANRDPNRWTNPTEFDIHREQKSHMGFGYGPHLCLGAHLARLEVKVALERLLELAPDYALRDIDFGHSWMNRGPEKGIIDIKAPEQSGAR